MKKILLLILTLVLCVGLMSVSADAASPSATFTGPSTVRAGNTITLTFTLSGEEIYGIQGKLVYDSTQLTLVSQKQLIGSPWKLESIGDNSNNIMAYDDELSTPINSSTKLFTVTFKVKQLAVGTKVNVTVKDIILAVGSNFSSVAMDPVTYSVSIAAPMSTNNKLDKLNVSNAELSPAFDPNVTAYTASVPFSVDKLILDASAADSNAKIEISNPTLTPDGTTKVTITVTAESGSKNAYTITVTRAKDPNYQPSGNNYLSNISVGIVPLSPQFQKDTTNYVLWLPYEVESVTVSATTEHSKASFRVEGGQELIAGADNEIKVICVAENGDEKIYTIIAKRAAAHNIPGTTGPTDPVDPPVPTDPVPTDPIPTDPKPTDTQSTSPKPTDTQSVATQPSGGSDDEPTNILLIIIYCIIGIIAVFLILVCLLFIISMRRKGRYAKKKKNRR